MDRIIGPNAAVEYLRSHRSDLAGSVLALFLNRDFDLLAIDCLGQGRAADCEIKPYALVQRGHELGAMGFLLIQNSPDRLAKATSQEIGLTREIRRAGEDLDLPLLGHLIITRHKVMEVAP